MAFSFGGRNPGMAANALAAELEVSEDWPGSRIAVSLKGQPPHLLWRVLLTLFLLPFVFGPVFVFLTVFIFAGGFGSLFSLASVDWPVLAVAAFFLAVWYSIVWIFVSVASTVLQSWTSVSLDASKGEFKARVHGWMVWLSRDYSVKLARLKGLKLVMGSEGGKSVDLSLSISYEDEAGKARSLFIPFKVKDVNHREEAMDLFFKAARIAGFDYYSVLRSDPRWLEIESSKGKVEGSVQVPVQGERQDYARDTALATVKEPGLKVKPFDPKSFSSDNELLEWAPGDRVKFFKPKPSISTILGFSIVIAAIAGGISFVVLPDFAWLLPFKPDALAASLAVAAAAGVSFGAGFHYLAKEQEALFDWGFGKVTFRAGSASRGFSFKEIQGLSLKGLSETRSSGGKNKSTYTVYWCELYAQLPGGNELVAATNEFREDAETPYDMSLPLAVELANALNVPWTWVDYSKKQPFNVNWSLNFK